MYIDQLRHFLPVKVAGVITGILTILLILHFVVQVNLLPINTQATRWTEQSIRKYTWLPKADYDM